MGLDSIDIFCRFEFVAKRNKGSCVFYYDNAQYTRIGQEVIKLMGKKINVVGLD